MKKFVMGLIVGLMLSFTATIYADDIQSLVGSTIQGEARVIADGKNVGNAIIVDGKSYAPVRSISEAAGYEVKMEDKQIIMTTPQKTTGGATVPEMPEMPVKKPNVRTVQQIDLQIYEVQTRIRALTYGISDQEKLISSNPDLPDLDKQQQQLQLMKTELTENQQKLASLEQEKAALIASQ